MGVIVHDLDDVQRRAAYGADITYGTNNEFGFDYLRDNMKYDLKDCVQRGHQFGIVDEVDSILIDEARTPLIISGPAEESTDKYYRVDKIIPKLIQEIDYTLDEKMRTATLTEEGVSKCERLLNLGNLYDPANMDIIHHVYQGLRAHTLFERDVDYVVKEGEVVIVDEFTGRQMPGRRWSDGLHQAVEAKEGVKIERENQTLATITFQNYFRMYKKLSGMTGTAETEAPEFHKIYKLEVVAIPTNKTLIRIENSDVVYRTEAEKFEAAVNGIIQEDGTRAGGIRQYYESGQPVLVGSISIEKSEKIAELLKKSGIPHQVLNAKQHEREAKVISQAGRKGAVTVSTNMAGRGTDILLGGNPEAMTREYCLKNKLAMPYAPAGAVIGVAAKPPQRAAGTETPAQADANAAGGNGAAPPANTAMVLFQQEGKIFQVPARSVEADLRPIRRAVPRRARRSGRDGRFAHSRHRAPRGAPHRQSASRPRRPPGRSRLVAIFPLARRRPAAHFRRRARQGLDVPPGHDRRRAHRIEADQQAHRKRAKGRRSAKLRSPQAPARIRRRDEQAARDDLLASPRRSSKAATKRSSSSTRAEAIADDAGGNLLPARTASRPVERHAVRQ